MGQIYKHKDGTYYKHVRNFGAFMVFQSVATGAELHITPEFAKFYTAIDLH